MKKIFILVAATLFTVAVFAADRRPSVTVQTNKNYEIQIDGKSYFTRNGSVTDISFLRDGKHTITVLKIYQGFFSQKMKKVVSSTTFLMRGNDIDIKVDQFGRVQVNEDTRFGNGRYDNDWDKKGYGDNDHKPMPPIKQQPPVKNNGGQNGNRF